LLRKSTIDVRMNHRELTTESNSTSDSIIRFCKVSVEFGTKACDETYLTAFFK
jgi:hypothetical protein